VPPHVRLALPPGGQERRLHLGGDQEPVGVCGCVVVCAAIIAAKGRLQARQEVAAPPRRHNTQLRVCACAPAGPHGFTHLFMFVNAAAAGDAAGALTAGRGAVAAADAPLGPAAACERRSTGHQQQRAAACAMCAGVNARRAATSGRRQVLLRCCCCSPSASSLPLCPGGHNRTHAGLQNNGGDFDAHTHPHPARTPGAGCCMSG
jgi:hypothetical protein